MKITQALALFAVLAVTANACGDKTKHPHVPVPQEPIPEVPVPEVPVPEVPVPEVPVPEVPVPEVPVPEVPIPEEPIPEKPIHKVPHGSVTDGSKIQHQEANNNGAEISDSSDSLLNLNNVAKGGLSVGSSNNENIQISQTANQ
ncbi:hypothetical protein INT45_002522 [Circinella minor]|uniref:Uncharacterized protein n=1 Tax=Circinella minor TaxID=1195481 RepID=A0A8H7VKG1_9FUNG|nr:hypothetical protein INT45_002522 [Circinella minor]